MKKFLFKDYSYLIVLFLGAVVFLQNASVPGFFHDGYLYAALGKNAVIDGRWLVPYLSDTSYPHFAEHPPFLFMVEGLFFALFGDGFLQARLFSGLWGLLLLFMVGKFANRYIANGMGFFAGVSLLLMPFFIKKVRFPNLDIPLAFFILCSCYAFLRALEDRRWFYWPLCGLSFGCALLMKGPPGLFLPLAFLIYLLIEKKLDILKQFKPWLSLISGFGIFLLWPALLYMNGELQIFWNWWARQITGTVIQGRETQTLNVFTYFYDLLEIMPLHLIGLLCLLKIRRTLQSLNRSYFLALVFAVIYFVGLSLMKFKYSHYLIPIFPFVAILTSILFKDLSDKGRTRFHAVFLSIGLLFLAASYVLPFGKKIKRDKFLIESTQQLLKFDAVKNVCLFNDSYAYWAAANYFAYVHRANLRSYTKENMTADELKINCDAAIVRIAELQSLKEQYDLSYQEVHQDNEQGLIFITLWNNRTIPIP